MLCLFASFPPPLKKKVDMFTQLSLLIITADFYVFVTIFKKWRHFFEIAKTFRFLFCCRDRVTLLGRAETKKGGAGHGRLINLLKGFNDDSCNAAQKIFV